MRSGKRAIEVVFGDKECLCHGVNLQWAGAAESIIVKLLGWASTSVDESPVTMLD